MGAAVCLLSSSSSSLPANLVSFHTHLCPEEQEEEEEETKRHLASSSSSTQLLIFLHPHLFHLSFFLRPLLPSTLIFVQKKKKKKNKNKNKKEHNRASFSTLSELVPSSYLVFARMECRGGICSGFNSNNKSPFDCILFDLDDTLYSSDIGIAGFVRQNIEEFLMKTCGVTAEKACSLRSELFKSHGSSLAGLRALGYDIHPDDYHSYVHGRLPYELIQPDPLLRDLLQSIPQTKIVFTNSDREHARKVLARLGLDAGCFDGVICFEIINPDVSASPIVLKPSPLAFEAAIRVAGIDPRRTLFLDDSERNVAAGKALGLRTALVGKRVKSKEADYLVGSIGDLRRAVPDVWSAAEGKKSAVAGQDKKLRRRGDLDSIMSATTAPVEA